MPGAKEIKSDPLELEFQIVVNHHMAVQNQTQVLCKDRKLS